MASALRTLLDSVAGLAAVMLHFQDVFESVADARQIVRVFQKPIQDLQAVSAAIRTFGQAEEARDERFVLEFRVACCLAGVFLAPRTHARTARRTGSPTASPLSTRIHPTETRPDVFVCSDA
jgi:hypothetical protein